METINSGLYLFGSTDQIRSLEKIKFFKKEIRKRKMWFKMFNRCTVVMQDASYLRRWSE